MNKLKPCPFCNGAAVDTKLPSSTGKEFNIVFCMMCGASTGRYLNKELAEEAWNRRAENGCTD